MKKQKKLKEKRVEGIESVYMFRSSDDGSNSFCGLGKDGILINIIKVDIGGDIKARHLYLNLIFVSQPFLLLLLCKGTNKRERKVLSPKRSGARKSTLVASKSEA